MISYAQKVDNPPLCHHAANCNTQTELQQKNGEDVMKHKMLLTMTGILLASSVFAAQQFCPRARYVVGKNDQWVAPAGWYINTSTGNPGSKDQIYWTQAFINSNNLVQCSYASLSVGSVYLMIMQKPLQQVKPDGSNWGMSYPNTCGQPTTFNPPTTCPFVSLTKKSAH